MRSMVRWISAGSIDTVTPRRRVLWHPSQLCLRIWRIRSGRSMATSLLLAKSEASSRLAAELAHLGDNSDGQDQVHEHHEHHNDAECRKPRRSFRRHFTHTPLVLCSTPAGRAAGRRLACGDGNSSWIGRMRASHPNANRAAAVMTSVTQSLPVKVCRFPNAARAGRSRPRSAGAVIRLQ